MPPLKGGWSYPAACTGGRSEEGDDLIQPFTLKVDSLGRKNVLIQPLALEVNRKKVILFNRSHWRSILEEEGDLIQPLTLKVNRKKVILFNRLRWKSILEEEGDLIHPLTLKVNPWGRMWSYSAAYTKGQSLRRKVILFSRLRWRSIPEEEGDLIQPLALKVDQKKVILFSRLNWRSIHLERKVILFSHLRWRSIPEEEGDLIRPLALKVDSLGKGMFDRLPPSGPWWNDKGWYDRRQSDIGETMMIWYHVIVANLMLVKR